MGFKAKHIPNALGIARVIACFALVPLMIWTPYTWYMMAIYIFAGFTDMIDGTLARHIKDAKSDFGATLDSVSDMLLVVITIVLLTPSMVVGAFGATTVGPAVWDWMYAGFLVALGVKIISGIIGRIKFGEMVYLHTYQVKLLGFVLFIIPIIYYFTFIVGGVTASWVMLAYNIYLCFAIFYICLDTTEEIIINMKLKKPCRDIKSIWGIKAANERFAAEDAAKAAAAQKAEAAPAPAPKTEIATTNAPVQKAETSKKTAPKTPAKKK